MIRIHHQSAERVRLLGSRDALTQIGAMIRAGLQGGSDSVRCIAKASEGDTAKQTPAFLRVKCADTPVRLAAIRRDLLVKGNNEALLAFCTVLETVAGGKLGAEQTFESEPGGSGTVTVTVVLE